MLFMNESEIDQAADRYADHPVLGPATKLLQRFRDMVNENSDGWAYWPAAPRAAKQLQVLIQAGDGTEKQLKRATTPLKSLCTRRHLPFPEEK